MSGPFRRRTLVALIVGAGVSFAAFLALSVFREELTVVRSSGNDAFSLSAVGHLAWVGVMDELGVPVVVRRERRARPPPSALVVAAEPESDTDGLARLRRVLDRAGRVLVVLPKWTGVESPVARRQVDWVTNVPVQAVDDVLVALELRGKVVRLESREAPKEWTSDGIEGIPSAPWMQLLERGLDPILACDRGILVGRHPDDPDTWVLTDPDVIANHGLRRGDNAAIAAQLVERARSGGVVIVDETIHGHGVERSMWRDLFALPLGLVLIHGALALGVALWAGTIRFGSPRPVDAAFAAGRTTLVDNTAALLLYGGRSRMLLGRYFERATDDVALAHGAAAGSTQYERREIARRVAARHGTEKELESIGDAVRECVRDTAPQSARGGDRQALALARRIHDWRGEILDGHPTGGRDGRRNP